MACEESQLSDRPMNGNYSAGCDGFVSLATPSRHGEGSWVKESVNHAELRPETRPRVKMTHQTIQSRSKTSTVIENDKRRHKTIFSLNYLYLLK